jgi:hypothetical protein
MPMVGKSRWFRRRKQFPVSELSAQKLSAPRLRLQLFPGMVFPRLKAFALGLPVFPILLLILTLAVGCSRPSGLPSDERVNQADQRKLPFEDNAAKGNAGSNSGDGNSREANTPTAANVDPRAAGGPPFQTPSSDPDLPPGTLVTVRVEKQIFTDRTGEEGTFAGVVDEPVVMDGKIAVPRHRENRSCTGLRRGTRPGLYSPDAGHDHDCGQDTAAADLQPLRPGECRGSIEPEPGLRGTSPPDRDPLAERSPPHLPPGYDGPTGSARDSIQQPESSSQYGIAAETFENKPFAEFPTDIFLFGDALHCKIPFELSSDPH